MSNGCMNDKLYIFNLVIIVEFCGKKTHRCHIGQYHLSNSFTFVTVKTDVQTLNKLTLENNEGAITNGQSRETGNIGYTRRRQTTQKHNTITNVKLLER
jgi:hypothetical protein